MTSERNILPPCWATATIGQLIGDAGIFIDGDWVESKDQDPDGSVRLIQLADIGDGDFRDKSHRFLTLETALKLRCTFLEHGDILIARMPEPLGRCCIFPLDRKEGFVTVVDVCVVRIGSAPIDNNFLMYAINSGQVRTKIADLQSGSTRKRISRGNLATIEIPLAPYKEQRRIVAKIEELFSELDKGVENLTTARLQLNAYRQSVLKYAFEGKLTADWRAEHPDKLETPEVLLFRIRAQRETRYTEARAEWQRAISQWRAAGEIGDRPARPKQPSNEQAAECDPLLRPEVPACWATASLGTLDVEVFDGPFGSNLKTSDYVEHGVMVIRLENIGYGRFIDESRSFVSEEKYEVLRKHTVGPGDIVFSSFVIDAIRSALVPNFIKFAVNKADCFAIRVFGTTVDPRFIQRFMESRQAFRQVEQMIHGVGRPRINTAQLKQLVFPVCSFEEQAAILETLDRILSEIDVLDADIRAQLNHVSILRQAILKKAFSGQLVAQDTSDEPASVLLERIRAGKEDVGSRRKKSNKNGKKEAA